jgi:hypothetical protein
MERNCPNLERCENFTWGFGRQGFVTSLLFHWLTGFFLSPSTLHAGVAGNAQDETPGRYFANFPCPEEYSSTQAKQAALQDFIRQYSIAFPDNNIRDMMLFRYRLLVAHSCIQTLKSMLSDVSPLSEMLLLRNRDYGPRSEEFDPETRVRRN